MAADGSLWFIWVQHQGPTRIIADAAATHLAPAATDLRDWALPALASGRALCGVAFAHLRRPGPPGLTATRVPEGWRLDGHLDWVTSWDIADHVLVMARGTGELDDRIVQVLIDPTPAPGLRIGPLPRLLAMGGTHTRPIDVDGYIVPESRTVAVVNAAEWASADADKTIDASPPAFGLTRAVLAELAATAERRDDDQQREVATLLADQCRAIRARAYGLLGDPGARSERLDLRARSLDLAVRATTALVAARGGAAMDVGTPAERWVREAQFLLVQAQTAATRSAQLALLTR